MSRTKREPPVKVANLRKRQKRNDERLKEFYKPYTEKKKDKCPNCGQKNIGQTGEYPCKVCGLPTTWDESFSEKQQ